MDKLVYLTINGEKIVTTDNHPFYVQGRGFINAGNLLVGDKLISVNGDDLIVEDYHIELTEEPVSVYNFQVEDFHTYFVGDCAVWVHNAQCPVPERTTASNGLDYQSNTKHTPGQSGNGPDAGIEPKNSLELFGLSTPSTLKPRQRYTYEKSTNTLHRFFSNNEGTLWHWSGSTNQGRNSLVADAVPIDIKRLFNLKKKGW